MASIARVVVPGYPHHVTQRGNRRQRTFFEKDEFRAYLELMAEWRGQCGVGIWAYCLMPNQMHAATRVGRATQRTCSISVFAFAGR